MTFSCYFLNAGLVLWIRHEHEFGEFLVEHEEAAEFVRIFVVGQEIIYPIGLDNALLHEELQVAGEDVPVQVQLIGVHEEAAEGHFLLGKHENGVLAEVTLANLGRGFEQGIAYDDEILGDGAKVFAAEFGVVEVVHLKLKNYGLAYAQIPGNNSPNTNPIIKASSNTIRNAPDKKNNHPIINRNAIIA